MKMSKSTVTILRKVGKIMLFFFVAILAIILALILILILHSPGTVKPFVNDKKEVLENSIAEKIHININDLEQGMIIRGQDVRNPVLLFLHGGPGMPEYFLFEKYAIGLEDIFTVCYWEQRGTGLSYYSDLQADTVTTEQLIADTITITNYLCERFEQPQIYLMGHSWGTLIGIQAAQQYPELYHAYVGIGQIARQMESEKLAYSYMLEQYQTLDTKMAQKLLAYPIYESEDVFYSYIASSLRDEAMHKLGIGTMRNMSSVITGIFAPVMQCRTYTLEEKINLWRGKAFSGNSTELRREMYTTDLMTQAPELEIPTYFMCGAYDLTVSYELSLQYYTSIQAPIKGFYTFENSAHSPLFEETELFLKIMQEDILNGEISLADR